MFSSVDGSRSEIVDRKHATEANSTVLLAMAEIVCTHSTFPRQQRVDTPVKRDVENLQLFISINVKRPTEKTCDQYGARVSGGA